MDHVLQKNSEKNHATLDSSEIERFSKIADEWWDVNGKFRPLHQLGPSRLQYITSQIASHFSLDLTQHQRLEGLNILDIGCGGGLICEPLARLGARVTGIDPGEATITAAKLHASGQGLEIDYQILRIEELVDQGLTFDVVLVLEVVEHIPDPEAFLKLCAKALRPGGLMILSTLNKTLKSFALAIIGAEYILRWLPVGTHQWERFLTPESLEQMAKKSGLCFADKTGLVYNPFTSSWSLSQDLDVNYFLSMKKQA